MLGGQQAPAAGLRDDVFKEGAGDVAFEQPIPILGEGRRRPHRVVHAEPDEPPKQQVVLQLLHQHPLTAHRIQHLEQQRPQEMLGRDRRAAGRGIIASNRGDNRRRASSVIVRIVRNGWSAGTRCSGDR